MKLRDWIPTEKLNWKLLSGNPFAIELLRENPEKIDWELLSRNPNAIDLLREEPDMIEWYYLSMNINAIEILKEIQEISDEISWWFLSANPHIFVIDYEKIKDKNKELNEQIIQKSLHPKRMLRLMEEYGEDDIYNVYFDE